MSKPSPAQAIMLRELASPGATVDAVKGRKGQIVSASGSNMASKSYGRLNPFTFGALVKGGWVMQARQRMYSTEYIISPFGRETLASLNPEDFIPKRPAYTADDLKQILGLKYQPPEWAFFPELFGGTGTSSGSLHRMDAWAMNTWPSKDLVKIAFEIKVYRSDFLKEMRQPEKRKFALDVSNQFYFVAPKNLISVDELPAECGLMVVSDEGDLRTKKAAPFRKIDNPSWMFVASLAREIGRLVDKLETGDRAETGPQSHGAGRPATGGGRAGADDPGDCRVCDFCDCDELKGA